MVCDRNTPLGCQGFALAQALTLIVSPKGDELFPQSAGACGPPAPVALRARADATPQGKPRFFPPWRAAPLSLRFDMKEKGAPKPANRDLSSFPDFSTGVHDWTPKTQPAASGVSSL